MTFLYFMVRGNQLLRRQSGHGHGGRSLALSVPREGFRRGQSLVVGGRGERSAQFSVPGQAMVCRTEHVGLQ